MEEIGLCSFDMQTARARRDDWRIGWEKSQNLLRCKKPLGSENCNDLSRFYRSKFRDQLKSLRGREAGFQSILDQFAKMILQARESVHLRSSRILESNA